MSHLDRWLNTPGLASITSQRIYQFALGLMDQGFSVGGMFLVNVALARTQTKEEYGAFALSYSIFIFLSGLQNAAVLEPFTVYASGRYQGRFAAYARLMLRSNVISGLVLSAGLLLTCLVLAVVAPSFITPSLLGLSFTVAFILTGAFLRRSFYVMQQPRLAAMTSAVFLASVAALLWIAARARELNGFSVFLILACGWVIAGSAFIRKLPSENVQKSFLQSEPHYWREHWTYARWVLATAFVFQFTHQGYYWLVAGFLSVKEVGELKAMYVLIAPVEQVMISISLLSLPILAAKYAAGMMDVFFAFWKRYALLMTGITLLFALFVRMVGGRVIHLLYAGKFDDLAPMLFLLALVPSIMAIGNTMSDAIRAAEQPRLVFYAYVSSAVATLVFGIPSVKYFGLRGAVYGMLFSAATYSGALAWAFRRKVNKRVAVTRFDVVEPALILPASEELL
jgi:O-antigen/teichoic acid export membrane protein